MGQEIDKIEKIYDTVAKEYSETYTIGICRILSANFTMDYSFRKNISRKIPLLF